MGEWPPRSTDIKIVMDLFGSFGLALYLLFLKPAKVSKKPQTNHFIKCLLWRCEVMMSRCKEHTGAWFMISKC